MKIHLIAIGGSAMHNLALSLHHKGYIVTGSDDKIFEPSKTRLKKFNLLPKNTGWFPNKITKELDCIILGMHAKEDNPELLKAQELKIPIFSYPEYIYNQSKNKKRIVIGGSHGKTSITAMILHVLHKSNIDCDYLIGAQLKGFSTMVRLTNAPVIILEGDEYLSSSIDKRPKFHLYKPHIAVLTGIAWDHINVFPTYNIYFDQFRIFKNMILETLIYCAEEKELLRLIGEGVSCKSIAYKTPQHKILNGITKIGDTNLKIFGKHNLQNLEAARLICNELGVKNKEFYINIASFKGANKRLELVKSNKNTAIYKDFAHSPSKLKATCLAMKKQFPKRKLIACMELHTFSSLNKKFLKQYKGCMDDVDIPVIYFNEKSIKHKNMEPIEKKEIYHAFNNQKLLIFSDSKKLTIYLKSIKETNYNLLMMSSGEFNGIKFDSLI